MSSAFPESQIVKVWQDYLPVRTDLVTEDDRHIAVVYPGRLNDNRGADLCDAVIATSRGLQKGDVEIHVKSSQWWGHRHHQDPLYNRVILHVVYWHDVAAAVTLQNGRKVPTLALRKYIAIPAGRYSEPASPSALRSLPCRDIANRYNDSFISSILDAAGDRRFYARVADFQEVLSQTETNQVLYQGIMEALGYTRNKIPMKELARRMTLARLVAAASEALSRDECLARCQALLMGTAGLLPSQHFGRYRREYRDRWVDRLEKTWTTYGDMTTMSSDDWHSFKVRPSGLPRRRLAALSYLLLRYRKEGLLPGLLHRLAEVSLDSGWDGLERSLLVAAEGYWGKSLDFGRPGARTVPALLGKSRAEVIVVNVLLPFAVAWSRAGAGPDLADKAREIYRRYPVLAENTLEKHMRNQLGINRNLVNSARRQQGLLHIYKTLCSQGKCGECSLGRGY